MRNDNKKIVLVKRKTRLENLIHKYNTEGQVKFIIEHSGGDFTDYKVEDNRYKETLTKITSELQKIARVQVLDRDYISNYIFAKDDIVVAVGQDGLVANTLKYLDGQPLIGVNPDPMRFDGVLLPFKPDDVELIVKEVLNKNRSFKEITLAKATLNDGQSLLGVNDIFIGQKTHVSAQYILNQNDKNERQSSSGIIVSTGLGSTGWFKSILAGASKISTGCSGKEVELRQKEEFRWNSDFLYYTVREPYPSKWTSDTMVFGKIDKTNSLKIQSLMPENGVIFSDGVEEDYIEFNSGNEAVISIANHKGLLIV